MGQGRQKLQRLLRDLHLLPAANGVRYFFNAAKYHFPNKRFLAKNPGFSVPPRALAFDAYSAPDWEFYQKSGTETAIFLADVCKRYVGTGPVRVLEWGCGPGRVIRHIPAAFGDGTEVHGTDYNPATIVWCAANLPNIQFAANGLAPPLPFDPEMFHFIYSISVLTHLSEAVGQQWVDELYRVLRPGAVLAVSTNGDSFLPWFLADELAAYQSRGFVVRGQFQEVKKLFLAYHSPAYLREKLFRKFEVLEFVPAGFPFTGQDLSILRKP